jgi:hypothetical protein
VATRTSAACRQDTLYSEGTAWLITRNMCYVCVIATAAPLPVVQLLAVPRCHWVCTVLYVTALLLAAVQWLSLRLSLLTH